MSQVQRIDFDALENRLWRKAVSLGEEYWVEQRRLLRLVSSYYALRVDDESDSDTDD